MLRPRSRHSAPQLTEEFVAVHRMHPLLPDDYTFRSLADDAVLQQLTFPELNALHARERIGEITMPNALYSLGIEHPGAITLHNFPRFLQHFERPDGFLMDLCATDIIRTRERGVPRYTKFRELLHVKPRALVRGADAEPRLAGGAAARLRRRRRGRPDERALRRARAARPRLQRDGLPDLHRDGVAKSDRFFTTGYTPKVYTRAGLERIEANSMRSVLLRHFPQLAPALEGVANPFAPWVRTARSPLSGAATEARRRCGAWPPPPPPRRAR